MTTKLIVDKEDDISLRKRNTNKKQQITADDESNVHNGIKDADADEKFISLLSKLKVDKNSYHLTRLVLIRYLAFIYFIAFSIALNQNEHLIGKSGLRPANKYMERVLKDFNDKHSRLQTTTTTTTNIISNDLNYEQMIRLFFKLPTVFWFFDWRSNIDALLHFTAMIGLAISFLVLTFGRANSFIMFSLWILYHSLVNVGQIW